MDSWEDIVTNTDITTVPETKMIGEYDSGQRTLRVGQVYFLSELIEGNFNMSCKSAPPLQAVNDALYLSLIVEPV